MSKCDTCKKTVCFNKSSAVVGCSQYVAKEKTNADRFRAMSDEEQQKFVRRFLEIEDFADWLKQPAEGE